MNDQPNTSAHTATPFMQRPWVGPVFITSLALNLFVVGLISAPLIFGHRFHIRQDEPDMFTEHLPPPPDRLMRRGLAALDPRDRVAMRKMVMDAFPLIRPHIKDMEDAKRELADSIAAEPYDEPRIKAAFDKMDEAMVNTAKAARESMLKGLATMPAEQRKRMAKAMSQMPGPAMVRQMPDRPDRGDRDLMPEDHMIDNPSGSPEEVTKPLDQVPAQ